MHLVLAEVSPGAVQELGGSCLDCQVLASAAQLGKVRQSSYLMKRLLLALYLREEGYLQEPLALSAVSGRRPELLNCSGSCSFTDSGPYCACAYDAQQLGIDLELVKVRSSMRAMLRRYFSAAEGHYVLESPQPAVSFCLLWTVREAVLKMLGLGLAELAEIRTNPYRQQVSVGRLGRLCPLAEYSVQAYHFSYGRAALCLSVCGQGLHGTFSRYHQAGFRPWDPGAPLLEFALAAGSWGDQ